MILLLASVFLALTVWYLWWNRSALYVNAAHSAFRKGDEPKTLEHFAKAEEAGRLGADVTASYVYLLLKAGRNDEALALVSFALAHGRRRKPLKETERRLLLTYRALTLWQQGQRDEAVVLLEDLYSQGYRTTALYGNLGFFLLEQGNLTRAEELCVEAAEWAPDGKVILDNLGSLRLLQGRWDEALVVYGRLLALSPKFPEAWWGAGRASLKTGDKDEARRRWEKALSLPFNAVTTVDRAAIEAALSQLPA